MARASASSSLNVRPFAGLCGFSRSTAPLFNAFLCCQRGAESGKRKFEGAVEIACGCCYRIKNILILCSAQIFGLGSRSTSKLQFRIMEHVGIRCADQPPAPIDAAEQIDAAFADAGAAMLP